MLDFKEISSEVAAEFELLARNAYQTLANCHPGHDSFTYLESWKP